MALPFHNRPSPCPPRLKLDAARKRFMVLKRKLENEFSNLDSMEAKVGRGEGV